MEKNDVSSFFFYMWNAWCKEECQEAFKESDCGWKHFWDKWEGICNKRGVWGAAECFYAELSESNRDLLVKRACSVYDRGKRIKDAEMEEFFDGMKEPEITIIEGTPDEKVELINNVNAVLNGADYKLLTAIELKSVDGSKMLFEKLIYRDNAIYAEHYDKREDCWWQERLENVQQESLNELYQQLIDENF